MAALRGEPPTRRFALVECDGRVAPFLGTGWDAEIISDFAATPGAGLTSYLTGMFTRTIPRHVFDGGQPQVVVTNLGAPALKIDERGLPMPLPGGDTGAVLYRGPA